MSREKDEEDTLARCLSPRSPTRDDEGGRKGGRTAAPHSKTPTPLLPPDTVPTRYASLDAMYTHENQDEAPCHQNTKPNKHVKHKKFTSAKP